jgi:hypothetical protein
VRSSETDVDLADVDLAAAVEVYSDPASALCTMAHNHPASQDVGLTPIQKTSGKPQSPTLMDLDIQNRGYYLLRIPLFPRSWLNKPPADVPEPSGWQTPIPHCSSGLWTCSPASSGHSTAGETGSPPRQYSPQRPSRPSSVPSALATGDLLGRTLLAEVSPVR